MKYPALQRLLVLSGSAVRKVADGEPIPQPPKPVAVSAAPAPVPAAVKPAPAPAPAGFMDKAKTWAAQTLESGARRVGGAIVKARNDPEPTPTAVNGIRG